MLWGFSQDETCEAVAQAARKVLDRKDHAGFALGAERIEQIYEAWLFTHRVRLERWKYSKNWLKGTAPPGSIKELAERLVRGEKIRRNLRARVRDLHGWRTEEISEYMMDGDSELTPRGQRAEDELFAPFRKK